MKTYNQITAKYGLYNDWPWSYESHDGPSNMYVVKDRFGFPIAYVSEVHQYRSAGSNAKVMADAPVFIEMLAKIIDAFDLTQVALSEGNKERAIEYGAMSFEAVAAAKRFLNPNQALHYNKSLGGAK